MTHRSSDTLQTSPTCTEQRWFYFPCLWSRSRGVSLEIEEIERFVWSPMIVLVAISNGEWETSFEMTTQCRRADGNRDEDCTSVFNTCWSVSKQATPKYGSFDAKTGAVKPLSSASVIYDPRIEMSRSNVKPWVESRLESSVKSIKRRTHRQMHIGRVEIWFVLCFTL